MPKINSKRGGTVKLRSGLEDEAARQLTIMGVPYEYETIRVPYFRTTTTYKPDFILPNGIIIETKGWFVSSDRSKLKLVHEQHPDLDIRIVFSNSRSRIGKKSMTTYGRWAELNGFPFADKFIPLTWTREARNEASLAAIERLRKQK